MGIGKYSPYCPHTISNSWNNFTFNCYGETPETWSVELHNAGAAYNEKTMFDGYDSEGFDSYGYSAFDIEGNYVGAGNGVDRFGYTEMDYLLDSINGGDLYDSLGLSDLLTSFKRSR